jgi:threonyl-tRNA synthetase
VATITVTVDGDERTLDAGTTGADVYADRRDVVVMRLAGELRDLARELAEGDAIEAVTIGSPEGLAVLRHSCAHVLAQAVQQVNPDAKLGIGPPIENGFFYDFDVAEPFTPESLKELEKVMQRIVNDTQTFRRRVVTDAEAIAELSHEPYKVELVGLKSHAGDTGAEGAAVEVGAGELTIYENVRKDGTVAWKDLCRGPHVPTTKVLTNGWSLTKTSSAYWRGSDKNAPLQRVYGTAWPTKDEMVAFKERQAEAERRDHRKLGAELDLFSFPDEIGSGLAVFHPKGGIIRNEMEQYSRKRHVEGGYEFVYSPHITKAQLFVTSGHLDWYADGMYPPMQMDEEKDAAGNVTKQGQDYYLKPMNCPFHNLIFRSRGRSYRELPLRMFEFGTVYRNEKSGVVHGLTRARGFTQDDAHIYCSREQMKDELTTVLTFVVDLLKDYGLTDFFLELSTKNPEKFVGDDAAWDEATETLRQVGESSGLEVRPDPGGAAFYGPKLSVQTRDAIGRSWQMSTIQLDFHEPELFELEYTAPDGTRQRPVMIHRALFGSIERFFAILTEHYAGAFPPWLAPVQVLGVPVAEPFNDYLADVVARLRERGVRAEIDASDERFPKKIRTASKEKVPFVLIAGGEDQEAGAVSFRFRDGTQDNQVPIAAAIERIVAAIAAREQV